MKHGFVGLCFEVSRESAIDVLFRGQISSEGPSGKKSASNLITVVVGNFQLLQDIESKASGLENQAVIRGHPKLHAMWYPPNDNLLHQAYKRETYQQDKSHSLLQPNYESDSTIPLTYSVGQQQVTASAHTQGERIGQKCVY